MELSETAKKYAANDEDRLMLRRVLDKLSACENKNIQTDTQFLNQHERAICENMLASALSGVRYVCGGGYPAAERTVISFLPDYLDEDTMEQPVCAVRAEFYSPEELSHRDFLGALMGAGVKRETVGDILVSEGSCDIVLLPEIKPFLMQNLESAGRAKLTVREIELGEISAPEPEVKLIRDTVASPRLDSIISAGFSISRDKAAALVRSGRVSLSFMPCEKPDREVKQGDTVSVRGMGRLELTELGHITKKGRTSVIINRFI